MPPCQTNNSVTHFCVGDCKELFLKCGHYMDQLEAAMNRIPGGMRSELSIPGCRGLNSTDKNEEANGTCLKLNLSE